MVRQCVALIALLVCNAACGVAGASLPGTPPKGEDRLAGWRAGAARTLAARNDAGSLATAAALTFLGPPARPKADLARAAGAALQLAIKASELAADNPALSWMRLQLCTNTPGCDIRDAATTLRWVDADNGAAWLPTLAVAQKDKDSVEVDRVLADMAEGTTFDLYTNRITVLVFDALKRARGSLPVGYLHSDFARLNEATGLADTTVLPSFSPLINACREAAAGRRDSCIDLSKIMQKSDTVMAQLVGFAIEKRLAPSDTRELRALAERRRLLEWRVAAANQSDAALLPWLMNARARSHIAKMRSMRREEDVCIAMLRDQKIPLEPPEDHR